MSSTEELVHLIVLAVHLISLKIVERGRMCEDVVYRGTGVLIVLTIHLISLKRVVI